MDRKQFLMATLISVVLLTLVFTPLSGQQDGSYDPWLDYNNDGIIDINDLAALGYIYGSSGKAINKTALLLDLLDRVEALEASTACLSPIIPNGDFEIDPTGTSYNDITNWNYYIIVHMGNPPTGDDLQIVDDYYFKGEKSLYSYLQTTAVPPWPGDSIVSQYLLTEETVCTTADYITLWISGDSYTPSSRYWWYIQLILTDGNNTYSETLRYDSWDGTHYDYYNATETGADGNTWKRYTGTIPDSLNKSNLTVTVRHRQASWDLTTASSWYRLDNIYFSDSEGNPTAPILELQSRILELQARIDALELKVEELESRVPQNGTISISPAAFTPKYDHQYFERDSERLIGLSSYYAALQLPDGATITNMSAFIYDNTPTGYLLISLFRTWIGGGGPQVMATFETGYSETPGDIILYDDTIDYATIDNEGYKYTLYAYFREWSGSLYMRTVQIEYEY